MKHCPGCKTEKDAVLGFHKGSGYCKACQHDRYLARRARDPEKVRQANRESYARNRESVLARQKARGDRKRWVAANRERNRLLSTTSNHRRRVPGSELSADDVKGVLDRAEGRCEWCNEEGPLQIDHAVPVSRGGTNALDNLVAACATCNPSKGDSLPSEWVPRYWRERIAQGARAC